MAEEKQVGTRKRGQRDPLRGVPLVLDEIYPRAQARTAADDAVPLPSLFDALAFGPTDEYITRPFVIRSTERGTGALGQDLHIGPNDAVNPTGFGVEVVESNGEVSFEGLVHVHATRLHQVYLRGEHGPSLILSLRGAPHFRVAAAMGSPACVVSPDSLPDFLEIYNRATELAELQGHGLETVRAESKEIYRLQPDGTMHRMHGAACVLEVAKGQEHTIELRFPAPAAGGGGITYKDAWYAGSGTAILYAHDRLGVPAQRMRLTGPSSALSEEEYERVRNCVIVELSFHVVVTRYAVRVPPSMQLAAERVARVQITTGFH
jgi:hypothetical protein